MAIPMTAATTRHSSIDALRERYQKTQKSLDISNGSTSSFTPVLEEEEEEDNGFIHSLDDEEGIIIHDNDEDDEEEYDNYSMYSSSSSIPDEKINFDLVYALHTFVATVDGQASVVKGDDMTLLDDTNSYWWLIRTLTKESEVGYIPAENIETPFERLARLNKHRNVEVTSLDKFQYLAPSTSNKTNAIKIKKKVKISKTLKCQLQVILDHEEQEIGWDVNDSNNHYEETFEKWEEDMSIESYGQTTSDDEEEIVEQQHDNKRSLGNNSSKRRLPLLTLDTSSKNGLINNNPSTTTNVLLESPLTTAVKTMLSSPQKAKNKENGAKPVKRTPGGIKKFLSIGKKNKEEEALNSSTTQNNEGENYHVLRIFSGNINVNALFSTVAVTLETNAEQLVAKAVEKFHIDQEDSKSVIEYYLTVKSMDGDEITLLPQDKPLAIFDSLNDHLTTPMPSLTYIRRLSVEQPTIKVTRVGVSKARQRAKARFGEDSVIKFSLHKRIKRSIVPGQIHIKISYYAEQQKNQSSGDNSQSLTSEIIAFNTNRPALNQQQEKLMNQYRNTMGMIRKSSLLRIDQQVVQQHQQKNANKDRIDKLVAIPTDTTVQQLTQISIEKFHLLNTSSPNNNAATENKYYMALTVNGGKETHLEPDQTISDIINNSNLIPKGTMEKLFVLRHHHSTNGNTSHRPSIVKTASTDSISSNESINRFVRRFLPGNNNTNSNNITTTTTPDKQQRNTTTKPADLIIKLDRALLSLEQEKHKMTRDATLAARPTCSMKETKIHGSKLSTTTTATSLLSNNSSRFVGNTSKVTPTTNTVVSCYSNNSSKVVKKAVPEKAISSPYTADGDVFDTLHKSSLSNMDDLEQELRRIVASSH